MQKVVLTTLFSLFSLTLFLFFQENSQKTLKSQNQKQQQAYLQNFDSKLYSTRTDKYESDGFVVDLLEFNKNLNQLYDIVPVPEQSKDYYFLTQQLQDGETVALIDNYRGALFLDYFNYPEQQNYYQWEVLYQNDEYFWLKYSFQNLYLCGDRMVGGTPRPFDDFCLWRFQTEEQILQQEQ